MILPDHELRGWPDTLAALCTARLHLTFSRQPSPKLRMLVDWLEAIAKQELIVLEVDDWNANHSWLFRIDKSRVQAFLNELRQMTPEQYFNRRMAGI